MNTKFLAATIYASDEIFIRMTTEVKNDDGNYCLEQEQSVDHLDMVSENSKPIQILVYPPKNKKFYVDEKSHFIQIEPIQSEMSSEVNHTSEYCNIALNSTFQLPDSETWQSTEEMRENVLDQFRQGGHTVTNKIEIEEILKIENPFKKKNCFLKGCKWSPDGLCLLSNSEDNILRLFEIPESTTSCEDVLPVLLAKEGGTIYSYEWYPKMNSSDLVTCVFASTSQNSPIHLWDAYTGCLRATYQPINQYDEVTPAYSLAFSPDGSKIYSGFKKFLRIFDISLPGRVSEERNLKQKGEPIFQTNIISCICINPVMPNIYALGSYDRTLGIYTEPKGELQCLLKGHKGGLTHLLFSHDGIQLYSGGRKDSEIICWDLRNPGKILFILNREVKTNQRIYFDLSLNDSHLITGSTNGKITLYDTKRLKAIDGSVEYVSEWKAHNDCVNGVNFHPFRPLLASSSGQYHLPGPTPVSEDDSADASENDDIENSLKIWKICLNE